VKERARARKRSIDRRGGNAKKGTRIKGVLPCLCLYSHDTARSATVHGRSGERTLMITIMMSAGRRGEGGRGRGQGSIEPVNDLLAACMSRVTTSYLISRKSVC